MCEILGEFFFSSPEPGRAQLEEKMNSDVMNHDVIKKKKNHFFFFLLPWYSWIDCAYARIIMHLLKLTLLGQLL